MRPMEWVTSSSALASALLTLAVFCAAWTIVGMLVMKFLVRQAPILDHAAIMFWAIVRVQLAVLFLVVLLGFFGVRPAALSSLIALPALCAVGWLVTRDLSRKYQVPAKFPAVGAKVVATMLIVTLLIVVAAIAITGA